VHRHHLEVRSRDAVVVARPRIGSIKVLGIDRCRVPEEPALAACSVDGKCHVGHLRHGPVQRDQGGILPGRKGRVDARVGIAPPDVGVPSDVEILRQVLLRRREMGRLSHLSNPNTFLS
jgi:hypothetical protein